MCGCDRRDFLGAAAGVLTSLALVGAAAAEPAGAKKVYTCPPCGCPNDSKEFDAPGACTVCSMPLIEKPATPDKPPPSGAAERSAAHSQGGRPRAEAGPQRA